MISIRKYFFVVVFFSNTLLANYSVYEGNIGKYKVEFYFDAFYKDDINIIYIDNRNYEPRQLNSTNKYRNDEGITFNIPDTNFGSSIIDTIVIKNIDFNEDGTIILNKTLECESKLYGSFKLDKKFGYDFKTHVNADDYNLKLKKNVEFNNVEIIQRESTKDYYFKTLISKKKGEFMQVVGINIYQKKDGNLFQTINNLKGYGFLSFTSINTNQDANFDEKDNDFYISKTTDSINDGNILDAYYSYDNNSGKFVYLNLSGRFITFDSEKKTAEKVKYCPKDYFNRVILTDLYQYTDKKKYTILNSKCKVENKSKVDYKLLLSRQCTKKERNFCMNASELLIDDYLD
ncbi:hypothetical protein [Gilliamella sp. Pas-s27]|uniref:hypothetical protein n=1 Tax=Gilliamella sp. Pas-s27 TaxID=2687311 RepID=UPI0013665283|nr:hypothetical protein [Gilliamella sp. Pas-s27]MWP48012.1 hypothetical protein [Gilliamella sp. Pas-s27]